MKSLSALPALLLALPVFGATPVGVAIAKGAFLVEGARVRSNATLFDGANVETGAIASELRLPRGIRVQLAAHSAARVWANRVLISSGAARVLGPTGVLAVLAAGQSWRLAMQQSITREGCLVYKDNGFLLQVNDAPEVLQLSGGALAANVGNRVQVTGVPTGAVPSIAPATQVVTVTGIQLRSMGGCLTAAAALNAQTSVPSAPASVAVPGSPAPAPTVARSGMSTGAKVAIFGAIAGGGAGAALLLGGKKDSTSP